MDKVLRVEGLVKHYTKKSLFGAQKTTRAVDGVSFALYRDDILVLAGESGSGKTTVAKLIMKSARADRGDVFLDGARVDDARGLRMQCQMIHQDPYDSINPRMKVSDIVAEPLGIHGAGDKRSRAERVIEVLREVKLEPAEDIAGRYPHVLSGGQRQRVVLARALALNPRIIIADEPVSMLDVSIRAEMLELLSELQKKHGISFIYITHDLATARYFGKRIAIMYLGKIMEIGPVDDVLLHPRHPYTQALIDAISVPDPENLNREKMIRINEPLDVDAYAGCRFRARCPYAIEKCKTEPELEGDAKRQAACFAKLD